MSNWKVKKSVCYIMVFLFFVTTGYLAKYYFSFSENNLEAVKNTRNRFYRKLRPQWLNPNIHTMLENVQSENPDELYLMILRTAMGRYRLREQAPGAYYSFLDRLRSGFWGQAFADDLTPALREMDREWLAARLTAMNSVTTTSFASLAEHHANGLLMAFIPGTKTSDLGSVIEARFAVLPGSEFVTAGEAIWATSKLPEAAPSRVRACFVEKTKDTSGTLPIYRLTMDMSDSPIWTNPNSEPTWIHFRAPGSVKWVPVDFKFYDASGLKPTASPKHSGSLNHK